MPTPSAAAMPSSGAVPVAVKTIAEMTEASPAMRADRDVEARPDDDDGLHDGEQPGDRSTAVPMTRMLPTRKKSGFCAADDGDDQRRAR